MQTDAFVTLLDLSKGLPGQAEKLGILPGDAVIASNGVALSGLKFRKAVDTIKAAGFPLRLSLLRKLPEKKEVEVCNVATSVDEAPKADFSSSRKNKRPVERSVEYYMEETGRHYAKKMLRRVEPVVPSSVWREDDETNFRMTLSEFPGRVRRAYESTIRLEKYRDEIWKAIERTEAAADKAFECASAEREFAAKNADALEHRIEDCLRWYRTVMAQMEKCKKEEKVVEGDLISLEKRAQGYREAVSATKGRLELHNSKWRKRETMWARVYDRIAVRAKAVRSELDRIETLEMKLLNQVESGQALLK